MIDAQPDPIMAVWWAVCWAGAIASIVGAVQYTRRIVTRTRGLRR